MWLLKLPFDQISIMINHKPNDDLLIAISFFDRLKMNTRATCSSTHYSLTMYFLV